MDKNMDKKISFGTATCLILIVLLGISLLGMWFYHNNIFDQQHNNDTINNNKENNIITNESNLGTIKIIKPSETIAKLFQNINELDDYLIFSDSEDMIEFYKNEGSIGDDVWSGLVSNYKASSIYKNFTPNNLNSFYTENCWCEGVEGDGIGETIEIDTFASCEKVNGEEIEDVQKYLLNNYNTDGGRPDDAPKITENNISDFYNQVNQIAIINGYAKRDDLWKNNNRVKKLKLTIDNNLEYILELEDSKDLQLFDINYKNDSITQKINMKFEILEVYHGDKFDDTCITSIYLSGGSNIDWGGR